MQQALQFCNVDHAMVALDPWFLPIIKMKEKKKFHLVREYTGDLNLNI
jgi:hypothetical protein